MELAQLPFSWLAHLEPKLVQLLETMTNVRLALILVQTEPSTTGRKDFVEEVLDWTDGRGVDLILDIIAGDYVPKNIKCLAVEGRMVIIATQGGLKTELNVLPIMMKRLTITGSTLRPRTVEQKAEIARELLDQAWPLLEDGSVSPVIDSVFTLDQVREAHQRLESGSHIGKILLQMP